MQKIRQILFGETGRAALVVSLFFVVGMILIFTAEGTADEGDSIMHYLYARDAYRYPEHFFNQWAKPLYVFITAPVAQGGFNAVKGFNLLCSCLALWLTFRSANKLQVAHAWIAPALAAFSPLLMIVTLSERMSTSTVPVLVMLSSLERLPKRLRFGRMATAGCRAGACALYRSSRGTRASLDRAK